MKFEYSKEKYMYKDIKDELPFDDDSYLWRSDEYGIYGLDFYPVEVPGSDGKLAQCFGKNIALETYASYDAMYLTKNLQSISKSTRLFLKISLNEKNLILCTN